MKKAKFLLGLVSVFVASALFTACNVGDDSPQEYQLPAVYNEGYPATFELLNGTKFETASLLSTLNDGDLVSIYFSLDDNNVFKLLSTPQKITTPSVIDRRLDTLGTANIATIAITPFKNYLWVSSKILLNADQSVKKAVYLSCDSLKLGSTSSVNGFVKNDTMFLQMHFKHAGSQGYTESNNTHVYSLKNLYFQQDSVIIAVRYKTADGKSESAVTKTKYKNPRY